MPPVPVVVHVCHPDVLVHAECQIAVELSGLPWVVRIIPAEAVAKAMGSGADVLIVGPGGRAIQVVRALQRAMKGKTLPSVLAIVSLADLTDLGMLVRSGVRGFVLDDQVARDVVPAIHAVSGGGAFLSARLLHAIVIPASRDGSDPAAEGLTPREQEILGMIAMGLSNKDAARRLDLSVRTVETHRLNIRKKTGAKDRRDLIRVAQHLGLFGPLYEDRLGITEARPPSGFHED